MQKMRRDILFTLFVGACAAAILACGAYLFYHYVYLPRSVGAENERYAALYEGRAPEPTSTQAALTQTAPAASAPPTATALTLAELPTVPIKPTPIPSACPTDPAGSAPAATADADEVVDVPLGTPDPDTIVYAAPTPPPVREDFAELLALNPETVGFLSVGELFSLPVVQRENDNEFYLTHNFEGEKSSAGCLFLDGVNRLEFDDKCLIVYGHNMKNGTMFGKLTNFAIASVLRKNAIATFDTLYEDRAYVPFACFGLDADPGDDEYFDFRRYQFSEARFGDFVGELKTRSLYDIPVDVRYGDDILLLVTCNYSVDDGRFVLALRRLRPDETEDGMRALVGQAAER